MCRSTPAEVRQLMAEPLTRGRDLGVSTSRPRHERFSSVLMLTSQKQSPTPSSVTSPRDLLGRTNLYWPGSAGHPGLRAHRAGCRVVVGLGFGLAAAVGLWFKGGVAMTYWTGCRFESLVVRLGIKELDREGVLNAKTGAAPPSPRAERTE